VTRSHSTAAWTIRILVALSVVGLVACNAATDAGTAAPSTPAQNPAGVAPSSSITSASVPASEPASALPDDSAGSTAVPTSISACELVTRAEASTLMGTGAAAGTESTAHNDKICSYSQEGLFLDVLVSVAPDAAAAKAAEPAFKTQIEQGAAEAGLSDVKVTELPEFEPGVDAATITGSATVSGVKLQGVSIYALKGAVLVGISALAMGGGSVPTTAAMEAQMRTSLGRLP
jgi:hypothetical protein